jgi:hypothetical protein
MFNWRYGCALIAALVLAVWFAQSVVRQTSNGRASNRHLKWQRLMELEDKRQAAREAAMDAQASCENEDPESGLLASKLLQIAFLTGEEEVERHELRDALNLPSNPRTNGYSVP